MRVRPATSELEARAFINAIINDTEVSTKPEQALGCNADTRRNI